MLRLYDNRESRNGYKVVMLLNHLGAAFERVELDIFKGASRTPEFLAKNPAGKIPALELEDGTVLAESGAILWYLAEGTDYLPGNRIGRAQVLRWICFEQNAHETSLAEARFILSHPELSQGRDGDISMVRHWRTDRHGFNIRVRDQFTVVRVRLRYPELLSNVLECRGVNIAGSNGLDIWNRREGREVKGRCRTTTTDKAHGQRTIHTRPSGKVPVYRARFRSDSPIKRQAMASTAAECW